MKHTTDRYSIKGSIKGLMQNYQGYGFRKTPSGEELQEFQFYKYGGRENEFNI